MRLLVTAISFPSLEITDSFSKSSIERNKCQECEQEDLITMVKPQDRTFLIYIYICTG